MNRSGIDNYPFVICCVAGTMEEPVMKVLAPSGQRRINLVPPKVDGNKVHNTSDPLEQLLIDDMGGHGQALEVLCSVLHNSRNVDYGVGDVMEKVEHRLGELYATWPFLKVRAVLLVVLGRQTFVTRSEKIGEYTVEDIEQLGLVTWNRHSKKLPFIAAKNYLRKMYMDPSYDQISHNLNPDKYQHGAASWESWEDFVVRFWCLKTDVFNGQVIRWQQLHSGAVFRGHEPGPLVQVQPARATECCPTKSNTCLPSVQTEFGDVQPSKCTHHILSATNNPGADFQCREIKGC